jgi:VanZ family protein
MTSLPTRGAAPSSPAAPGTRRWWLLTATYFAASCLMHLQFSLWLVRPRATPWGQHALSELVPAATAIGAMLLGIFLLRQLRRSPRRWPLAAAWLLWALAVFAVDRYLTYSANEFFHYPQYALLAWLLARTLDPNRSRWIPGCVLFWTTLLGAVDELLQYLWITASYSNYYDFNDVLVNLLAAVAGVLVFYGSAARPAASAQDRRWPRLEAGVVVMLALLVAAGIASERLQFMPRDTVAPGGLARDSKGRWTLYLQRSADQYGSWQSGPRRGVHYVLRPGEALLGLAIAAALLAALGRLIGAPQPRDDGEDAATISPSSAGKSR